VAELLFTCALAGAHLSRFAEDLIIYGSSEFGFVQFGDTFTSGSSMMPQKRNPDAMELTRGAAARLLGDHVTLLATIKGLPSSYNKDLQDDKRALFDAVDTLLLVLPAFRGALTESAFNHDRMRSAVSSSMMATDLADYLVRRGATFREAHAAVGGLIRQIEAQHCELDQLPLAAFTRAHSLFGADVFDTLGPARSLQQREVEGGTGPDAVRAQLDAARSAIRV
jgi:argininosuccinate lyase